MKTAGKSHNKNLVLGLSKSTQNLVGQKNNGEQTHSTDPQVKLYRSFQLYLLTEQSLHFGLVNR